MDVYCTQQLFHTRQAAYDVATPRAVILTCTVSFLSLGFLVVSFRDIYVWYYLCIQLNIVKTYTVTKFRRFLTYL